MLIIISIGAENGDKYLENELGQLLQNKTNHFTPEELDILHLSVNQTYLIG